MDKKVTPALPAKDCSRKAIDADDLFAKAKEVPVHFRGQTYRLRLTRNDKLILTK
jgi:hemin uptake protein HemP